MMPGGDHQDRGNEMYDKFLAIGLDYGEDCVMQRAREEVVAYRIYHAALLAMQSKVYIFEALPGEQAHFQSTLAPKDLWKSLLTPWKYDEKSFPEEIIQETPVSQEEKRIMEMIAQNPHRIKLRNGWPYLQLDATSRRVTQHSFGALRISHIRIGYLDTYFIVGTVDEILFKTDTLPASFRLGSLDDARSHPVVKQPFIIDAQNQHGPFSIHPMEYRSTALTALSHIAHCHYRLKRCCRATPVQSAQKVYTITGPSTAASSSFQLNTKVFCGDVPFYVDNGQVVFLVCPRVGNALGLDATRIHKAAWTTAPLVQTYIDTRWNVDALRHIYAMVRERVRSMPDVATPAAKAANGAPTGTFDDYLSGRWTPSESVAASSTMYTPGSPPPSTTMTMTPDQLLGCTVMNAIFPLYVFTRALWFDGNGVVHNAPEVFADPAQDQQPSTIQKLFEHVTTGLNNGNALSQQICEASCAANRSMRRSFGATHEYDLVCAFISALTLLAHWTDPTCRTVIFLKRVLCAVDTDGWDVDTLIREHQLFIRHHVFCSTCNNFSKSDQDNISTCVHCKSKRRRKK